MAKRRIRFQPTSNASPSLLRQRFEAIRDELHVPEQFPPDVLAEAERSAASPPQLDRDETAVPFLTIDPAGSMDLDQAMCLQREGEGYRVRYAIADVPGFVAAGGAIDAECRRRGLTIYAPDKRTPLHPPVLSESAASLLPGHVRPAYVWDIRLDTDGEERDAQLYRAMVRSGQRLDYDTVQRLIDEGTADEPLVLLKEIGELRIRKEQERGGASLPMPDQEVVEASDGHYNLRYRPPVPSEDWNAQISLLTGMVAATMMMSARVGILRTMPVPDPGLMKRYRRQVAALRVSWPAEQGYGDFLRSLDRTEPRQLALIHEATTLFRGAGYTPFDGELPGQPLHAAVAAPYAHVTAPLRRLVDRFGLVICEAVSSGGDVPGWVREALPALPQIMKDSDRRANAVERACVDAVEAAVLSGHVGETFAGVVIDVSERGDAVVQLTDPAIVAHARGRAGEGQQVRVRLTSADVCEGQVHLQVV